MPRRRYSGATPMVAIQEKPSAGRGSPATKPTIFPSSSAFKRTMSGKVNTAIRSSHDHASLSKQARSNLLSALRSRNEAATMFIQQKAPGFWQEAFIVTSDQVYELLVFVLDKALNHAGELHRE